MVRILLIDASGKQVPEDLGTLAEARKRAREYVTRNDPSIGYSRRRDSDLGRTHYYRYRGEREAYLFDE